MIGQTFSLFSFIDNLFQKDCITLCCSERTLGHSTVAGDTISQYYTDNKQRRVTVYYNISKELFHLLFTH